MTSLKNQKGLTMIELLLSISIGAIVLIIAFNLLNTILNTYKNNVVKSNLQQEANLVMATMTTLYQQENQYSIEITNDKKLNISSQQNQHFSFEKEYNYTIMIDGNSITHGSTIKIYTNKPISIDILIDDKNNPKNTIHLSTILKRL